LNAIVNEFYFLVEEIRNAIIAPTAPAIAQPMAALDFEEPIALAMIVAKILANVANKITLINVAVFIGIQFINVL